MHTLKVETELLQPPLHVSLKGGCDTNRITSKGITIPGSPKKIEPRFMVNCRVCKSLGKKWLIADLWNRRVGETQHTEERFGDNWTYINLSRGRKSKINHERWIIFMLEAIVVLKLSESKATKSRPNPQSEQWIWKGPIWPYQSFVVQI